jgi:PAS domain-containing protein
MIQSYSQSLPTKHNHIKLSRTSDLVAIYLLSKLTWNFCLLNVVGNVIQNHNSDSCFVWVWNLVSHIKGTDRLRVFENRALRRIFGPKRDEVTGEWRKFHNEELHNLYSSPDIIRQIKSTRMRWAGNVARMGEERKVYKVLAGKPEGKRSLGRPRRRW